MIYGGTGGFNSSTYEIYQMKESNTDGPLSPESPKEELGAKGHKWAGTAILAAVGIQAAHKVLGMLRTEIADTTGDDSLQADFNNVVTGATMVGAIIATKGAALIAYGIQGSADMIMYYRENKRKNREIAYNNMLRGARTNITGVIYD